MATSSGEMDLIIGPSGNHPGGKAEGFANYEDNDEWELAEPAIQLENDL